MRAIELYSKPVNFGLSMVASDFQNSGAMAAAFALYPTRMEDLMAVADTGAVMPTKSTWFEPKLADGLVTHVLD